MKSRIIITDKIIADAVSQGRTVTEVLAAAYQGDIADRVKSDERLKNLDAFELAMYDAGISRNSIVNEFYQTTGNELLFPTFIDRRLRESVAGMNILPFIVGSEQSVSGMSIQGMKLIMDDANKDNASKKRVVEGTDLPLAILKLADMAITLKKRGRAVQASYETIMYQTLDVFSKHLDMIANDVAGQQVGDAIDVMVKGDGNNNAAEFKEMNGAALTNEEIALFAIDFWKRSNLPLTTLITGEGAFFAKLLLTTFNVNEVNGMIAGARFNFPQAQLTDLNVLFDKRVPVHTGNKEQLIGLNKDYALTKYVAAGSNIREYDKNIRNQTNIGTVSEIAGFAKFNDAATLLLRQK